MTHQKRFAPRFCSIPFTSLLSGRTLNRPGRSEGTPWRQPLGFFHIFVGGGCLSIFAGLQTRVFVVFPHAYLFALSPAPPLLAFWFALEKVSEASK